MIGFLFDLDGVLIDSESEYTRIWAQVNQEFPTGIPDLPSRIKGCTLTNILSTYFTAIQRPLVEKRLYELEARMHYSWNPGARELLNNIHASGWRRALVTSSDNMKMKHLDEELPELQPMMDVVVTGNMVSHSKPDPEGYLLAAKLIGCQPRKCVVFEDSLQGVKAGHNAGCYVVGVAGTLDADVISPFSDIVVNSLTEIDLPALADTLTVR